MQTNNKKNNNGFTLIELMVATSIFIIVMLASMSSLFILLNASKNSRALRFTMDNISFAMESMTRSIRMGTNYYCIEDAGAHVPMDYDLDLTNDCDATNTNGGTLVAFIPQGSTTSRVGYKISARNDANLTHSLQRCDAASGCVDVVSPDVDIQKLKFFVKGSSPNDNTQASVYIIMKGTAYVKGVPTSFSIQTMASQRNF